MDAFEKALAATLEYEGFFSNDPADHGGAVFIQRTATRGRAKSNR